MNKTLIQLQENVTSKKFNRRMKSIHAELEAHVYVLRCSGKFTTSVTGSVPVQRFGVTAMIAGYAPLQSLRPCAASGKDGPVLPFAEAPSHVCSAPLSPPFELYLPRVLNVTRVVASGQPLPDRRGGPASSFVYAAQHLIERLDCRIFRH
jgi:hypothetical protein